jgi:hypothetical protein
MAEKRIYVSTTETIPELAEKALKVTYCNFVSSQGCYSAGDAMEDLVVRCIEGNYDAVIGLRIAVDPSVSGHTIGGDGEIKTTPFFTAYGTGIRWAARP